MLPLGNLTAAGRTADRCNFGTTCLSTRHNVIRIFFRGAPPSPSTGGGRGSHLARHGPGSIHPPPLSRKGGVRGSGWSGGSGLRRERHSCGTVGRDLPMSLGVATGQRTPNPLSVGRQCRWLRADPSSCIRDRYAILSSRARVSVAGSVRGVSTAPSASTRDPCGVLRLGAAVRPLRYEP